MKKHVALIGGITGAVGSALARELCSRNNWEVNGLSRNAPTRPIEGVNYSQLVRIIHYFYLNYYH